MFIASSCLLAEDAPKQISQDFVKPGLKALIAVRNAATTRLGVFPVTVQSVIDDAELEAATDADKAALALVRQFQSLRTRGAMAFYTLSLQHETELIGKRDPNAAVNGVFEAAKDPAAIKNFAIQRACADGVENILRSRNLAPVPECDMELSSDAVNKEPKIAQKPAETTQVQPTPARRCYDPKSSRIEIKIAKGFNLPKCQ